MCPRVLSDSRAEAAPKVARHLAPGLASRGTKYMSTIAPMAITVKRGNDNCRQSVCVCARYRKSEKDASFFYVVWKTVSSSFHVQREDTARTCQLEQVSRR